jgi:arylsulfatase A-like enzyme
MADRPNLVLITADQWRGDCLSGIDAQHPVLTPHLTQLGQEGTRYARAYADCPICMPQRVTTLTGQVASRFGKVGNFGDRSPIDPARSLPGRLVREAGYQAHAAGKMHFEPSRARFGFDEIDLHPNDYVNWLEGTEWAGGYRGHGVGGNEAVPVTSAVPERYTHTHWIVEQAVRFLRRRDPDCPFFLWVVFEAPHSPFDPPEPYDRMYDRIDVPQPLRGNWLDDEQAPAEFKRRSLLHNFDHLSDPWVAETRRRYYGQITHIDYQLGLLLGELRHQGLWDHTAVCFTADHGEHLGDHGIFGKGTFLQGSADVPLQMKFPNGCGAPVNRIESRPVLTADLCPTFLRLAGLEPDKATDGISLLDDAPERRIVCGETHGTAMATNGRWKYIYWPEGGKEMLFDLQADPCELTNLAGREEATSHQQALRGELIAHLRRHNRPLVEGGSLVVRQERGIDVSALRAANPFACRGPIRLGQGYHGYQG